MSINSRERFCAFCRSPKRIYPKRRLGLVNFSIALFASLLFMYLLWHDFDARVVVIFAVCVAFGELFVQFRWRLSVICQNCGFDPVLYLKNSDQACSRVREHMENLKLDPNKILRRRPVLPSLTAERAKELEKLQEIAKPKPRLEIISAPSAQEIQEIGKQLQTP